MVPPTRAGPISAQGLRARQHTSERRLGRTLTIGSRPSTELAGILLLSQMEVVNVDRLTQQLSLQKRGPLSRVPVQPSVSQIYIPL